MANKQFHFITGLPRSGSTLLSAILRQNPRFHADISSPVASLIMQLMPMLSPINEFEPFLNNDRRHRILRGVVENFYEDNRAPVIFDTNRTWTQRLPVLAELFPHCRLICCVRSLTDILQSFETLYLRYPLQLSTIIGLNAGTTVFSRIDALLAPTGMVGVGINGLKEAFYGPHSDRLLVVPYQTLVTKPQVALASIYEFIGQKPFNHDFQDIAFSAPDYDRMIGTPGLHDVRRRLGVTIQRGTIPPEISNRYVGPPFWVTDGSATKANLTLV